jgi:hypothetical protein
MSVRVERWIGRSSVPPPFAQLPIALKWPCSWEYHASNRAKRAPELTLVRSRVDSGEGQRPSLRVGTTAWEDDHDPGEDPAWR